MNLFTKKKNELHPENIPELQYWSGKWGITIRQLNEAIVDTGSTDIGRLKAHLRKNHISKTHFLGWIRTFTGKFSSAKLTGYH
jgi:hypothetical protein